jgi:hypothetical protein
LLKPPLPTSETNEDVPLKRLARFTAGVLVSVVVVLSIEPSESESEGVLAPLSMRVVKAAEAPTEATLLRAGPGIRRITNLCG